MTDRNNLGEKQSICRYHICYICRYLFYRSQHICINRTKVKNLKETELKLNKNQLLPSNLSPSYVFQHVTECEKYPSHTFKFLRCIRYWIMIKNFLLLNENKQKWSQSTNFPTIIFVTGSSHFLLIKEK